MANITDRNTEATLEVKPIPMQSNKKISHANKHHLVDNETFPTPDNEAQFDRQ